MKHVIKRLEKGYRNYNPQKNWERLANEEHPYCVPNKTHTVKHRKHKRKK